MGWSKFPIFILEESIYLKYKCGQGSGSDSLHVRNQVNINDGKKMWVISHVLDKICVKCVDPYSYYWYVKQYFKKLILVPCVVINCFQLARRYDAHSYFLCQKVPQCATSNIASAWNIPQQRYNRKFEWSGFNCYWQLKIKTSLGILFMQYSDKCQWGKYFSIIQHGSLLIEGAACWEWYNKFLPY